jgi:nucleotide-binding universal stress UspA family protein
VFRHALVGYDGSEGSRGALSAALGLAKETPSMKVTVLTVQHHLPRYAATVGEVDEERQVEAAEARRLASEVRAQADEHQLQVETVAVAGHPAHELVRIAAEYACDLIIVGHTSHPSLRAVMLGGVSEHVARHATCSVLIAR